MNLLNAWMDPRHIQTHAFPPPTDEERERPFMWRFWRALPPKGKIGILFGNWYPSPIVNRARKITKAADLDQSIEEINRFEKMLSDEGTLILKIWMHLSKPAQKKRLKALEKNKKTRWRVTRMDWEHFGMYDKFRTVSERVLRHTSTGYAPWIVVEGADENYRSLTVARILLEALRKRQKIEQSRGLEGTQRGCTPATVPGFPRSHQHAGHEPVAVQEALREGSRKYQGRLNLLTRNPKFRERSLIVVFEGSDAAGKGGSIRRITGALDARQYQIIPIAAPTEEERAQPYLWRFGGTFRAWGASSSSTAPGTAACWSSASKGFARRPTGCAPMPRSTTSEDQLVRSGAIVAKFWLTITAEEQLRRFKEREKTRFKRFKITDEDWRNRKKWAEYEHAVCDMVDRSSTEIAPWTLVEANDKFHARIKVLKTVCDRLEDALK
ncbi:MAG: polyphosphate:AMP phosphotransferase [Rhodocyclaceae bacterium]|nr:polyphosphate:AMP phosphotransferase [Rhodocyclaceae bacterium]